MNEITSKITSKSQTVIPRDIREKLGLKPGDRLHYKITDKGIIIEKALMSDDDPFAVFSEWSGEEDEIAYAEL